MNINRSLNLVIEIFTVERRGGGKKKKNDTSEKMMRI